MVGLQGLGQPPMLLLRPSVRLSIRHDDVMMGVSCHHVEGLCCQADGLSGVDNSCVCLEGPPIIGYRPALDVGTPSLLMDSCTPSKQFDLFPPEMPRNRSLTAGCRNTCAQARHSRDAKGSPGLCRPQVLCRRAGVGSLVCCSRRSLKMLTVPGGGAPALAVG